MGYLYIAGTVLFTVYGQLVLKWRIVNYGAMPEDFGSKLIFLFKLLFDPYIFSGFAAAFVASFFWMSAMTKLELSFAYPFMSAAFVLVFLFSVFFFFLLYYAKIRPASPRRGYFFRFFYDPFCSLLPIFYEHFV